MSYFTEEETAYEEVNHCIKCEEEVPFMAWYDENMDYFLEGTLVHSCE